MSDFPRSDGWNRPKLPANEGGQACATPQDVNWFRLLGGDTQDGVAFTTNQSQALNRLYGFTPKQAGREAAKYARQQYDQALQEYEKKLLDPKRPSWNKPKPPPEPNYEQIALFYAAGATRNRNRFISEDGLRVIAFIAKFLEPNDDPVKWLVRLMDGAGYDVGDHYEWASEIEEDNEDGSTGTQEENHNG